MKNDKVLIDKTFITQDEEYNPVSKITAKIEDMLEQLKMDTYNKRYLVTVIVKEYDDV